MSPSNVITNPGSPSNAQAHSINTTMASTLPPWARTGIRFDPETRTYTLFGEQRGALPLRLGPHVLIPMREYPAYLDFARGREPDPYPLGISGSIFSAANAAILLKFVSLFSAATEAWFLKNNFIVVMPRGNEKSLNDERLPVCFGNRQVLLRFGDSEVLPSSSTTTSHPASTPSPPELPSGRERTQLEERSPQLSDAESVSQSSCKAAST